MYTSEDILERLRVQPFQPFRFVMSEGLRYEIKHPDLVFVGRRDVTIGHPDERNPLVYDRVTRVALAHIVGMEEIPAQADA